MSNQGGRSRALAADFLIQALAEGTWETGWIFNRNTPIPNLPRVLSQPWFLEISGGERGRAGGREALGRWGEGKQRARTVPSLRFGLVRAESQLASLGLDEKRAGMRRAHACTYQQM